MIQVLRFVEDEKTFSNLVHEEQVVKLTCYLDSLVC
jgi:hypothetical protein